VVYFFVCESQGRSLEEIDSMYISHVAPRKSKSWVPPEGEMLGESDRRIGDYAKEGARDPADMNNVPGHSRRENIAHDV
jgi:SP family sugar:H+ symporter-like MFS transporter